MNELAEEIPSIQCSERIGSLQWKAEDAAFWLDPTMRYDIGKESAPCCTKSRIRVAVQKVAQWNKAS